MKINLVIPKICKKETLTNETNKNLQLELRQPINSQNESIPIGNYEDIIKNEFNSHFNGVFSKGQNNANSTSDKTNPKFTPILLLPHYMAMD